MNTKPYFILEGTFAGLAGESKLVNGNMHISLEGMFTVVVQHHQVIAVQELIGHPIRVIHNSSPLRGQILWITVDKVGIQSKKGQYTIETKASNLLDVAKEIKAMSNNAIYNTYFVFDGPSKGLAGILTKTDSEQNLHLQFSPDIMDSVPSKQAIWLPYLLGRELTFSHNMQSLQGIFLDAYSNKSTIYLKNAQIAVETIETNLITLARTSKQALMEKGIDTASIFFAPRGEQGKKIVEDRNVVPTAVLLGLPIKIISNQYQGSFHHIAKFIPPDKIESQTGLTFDILETNLILLLRQARKIGEI